MFVQKIFSSKLVSFWITCFAFPGLEKESYPQVQISQMHFSSFFGTDSGPAFEALDTLVFISGECRYDLNFKQKVLIY
jgi:hypothetical protein